MKLLDLTLTNFKGQPSFEILPKGNDISVFGDNACGKTTLFDAYCWLLFGKDSQNRADFEIKTLGADGQPKHKLNHEVEGVFDLDGQTLTLKKVYREKWVKQRGSAEQEFEGHTTDFFVNGVPVAKKEYDQQVASICSEQRFRLLSDPYHFNLNLSWQDRRKILLEVCGDVTDADVVASDPKLSDLPAILGARTMEDHRKIIDARRKELNREIETVPIRIDEMTRSLTAVGEMIDTSATDKKLSDLRSEKSAIQAGGQTAEKTKQLREAEGRKQDILNRLKAEVSKEFDEAHAKARVKAQDFLNVKTEIEGLKNSRKLEESKKAEYIVRRDAKRKEHAEESAKVFAWSGTDTCDACGQSLPSEKIEAAKANALAQFNQRKGAELERIVSEGKRLADAIADCDAQIARIDGSLSGLTASLSSLGQELQNAKADAESKSAPSLDDLTSPELSECEREIVALKSEIEGLAGGNTSALADIDRKITAAEAELADANSHNAQVRQAEGAKARIADLEAEHKKLAAELENIMRELFLCEEFVKAKVSLLTERINSRFTTARFKLFELQVNGGIAECCETTVNGVPFGSLNHGMRLNAGLDIISTLSEHWGFTPPIVIDNAESITSISPTPGQQIRLVVSATDKVLRVETATAKEKVSV